MSAHHSEGGLFYPIFDQSHIFISGGTLATPENIFTGRRDLPELRRGLQNEAKKRMGVTTVLARLAPDVFENGPLYIFPPESSEIESFDESKSEPSYLIPVPRGKIPHLPMVNMLPDERNLNIEIDARNRKILYYCIIASVTGSSPTEVSMDMFIPVASYIRFSVPYGYCVFFNLGDQQASVMGISVGPDASKGIDIAIHPPILEEIRHL